MILYSSYDQHTSEIKEIFQKQIQLPILFDGQYRKRKFLLDFAKDREKLQEVRDIYEEILTLMRAHL